MNKMLELLPLALFFLTYLFSNFFTATQVLTFATAILLAYQYIQNPKQPVKNHIGSLLIIGLGTMTLFTQNAMFLVWKPTIMYSITAASLLGSQLIWKRSLTQIGFSRMELEAPSYCWWRLDVLLSVCFIAMAILNLYIFNTFGIDQWIKFKAYSLFGWLALFIPLVYHIESRSIKPETTPDAQH